MIWQFSTPPAVKLKLVAILSTSWGFPSIHVAVPFSSVSQVLFIISGSKPPYLHREVSLESLYQIRRGTYPQSKKNGYFLHPSCQTGGHIVHVKGIMTSLLQKPPWYRQLQLLYLLILTAISISPGFQIKIAAAKES